MAEWLSKMEGLCLLCDDQVRYTLGEQRDKERLQKILRHPVILFTEQHTRLCQVCCRLIEDYETLSSRISTLYKTISCKYGCVREEGLKGVDVQTQTSPYIHPKENAFCCPVCAVQYKLKTSLQKHLKSHRKHPVTCSHCCKVLRNATHLYEHQRDCCLGVIEERATSPSNQDKADNTKTKPTREESVKHRKRDSANENSDKQNKKQLFPRRESKRISERKSALKDSGNVDAIQKSFPGDSEQDTRKCSGESTCDKDVKRKEEKKDVDEKYPPEGESVELVESHVKSDDEVMTFSVTSEESQKYICDICRMSFSSLNSCKRHGAVHSDVKPYKCDVCNMAFKWPQSLDSHSRIHTGAKPYSCKWCSKSFRQKGTLKQHIRSHLGEKIFRCRFCDSGFTRSARLKIHEMSHTGERPYKCDQCDAAFADPQIYKKHMMNHEGLKPFSCKVCGMAFVMARYLNEHMKKHTGERKYLCAVCARAFPNAGRLQRHMLIHSQEKPFQCQFCDKEFRYREALKEHIDRHYGAKPYLCTECGKTFTHRTGLTQHKSVHSTEKRQTCSVCFKCFKTRNKLNRHMKTHPNVSSPPTDPVFKDSLTPQDTVFQVTKGTDAECPIIEIVPLATNVGEVRSVVSARNDVTPSTSNQSQDSIQPLIQAINQALASRQDDTLSDTTSVTQAFPDSITVSESGEQSELATLSQYTTVGLLQESSTGSVYQVVSPGGDVLYQSADNELIRQLTSEDETTDLNVSDVGVTIMQIQVPSVQQEIQIPNN